LGCFLPKSLNSSRDIAQKKVIESSKAYLEKLQYQVDFHMKSKDERIDKLGLKWSSLTHPDVETEHVSHESVHFKSLDKYFKNRSIKHIAMTVFSDNLNKLAVSKTITHLDVDGNLKNEFSLEVDTEILKATLLKTIIEVFKLCA
jgi:hypothetical protein